MSTPTEPGPPDAIPRRLPQPGEVIGGKYRVVRSLGAGGMGAVVEVSHLELGQRMAVKVMLPGAGDDAKTAARFLREGKAAAALKSAYAARIIDVGRGADGSPFLVMELLEGDDLERHVHVHGPMSIPDAVGHLLQACDAIAEAHALGIVHRDLKPSNIFLCKKPGTPPTAKVLDFGISKATKLTTTDLDQQGLTATDATLGSPRYMSPEQLRDARRVDARTDIWSLGLVLHWLLTGRFAFDAETLGQHLMMLVSEPPTPLRAHRPDAPAALEAVVMRCLERQIDQRFQHVGELALALAPFAAPWARPLVPHIVEVSESSAPPRPAPPPPSSSPSTTPPPSRSARSADAETRASWEGRRPTLRPRGKTPWWMLAGAVAVGVAAIAFAMRSPPPTSSVAVLPSESTTPQPSPSAPASAAPPALKEAHPAEIEVRINPTPKDAIIEVGGQRATEGRVRLPRRDAPYSLIARAQGYETSQREVRGTADTSIDIELQRAARKTAPSPRPKPSIAPPSSSPSAPPGNKFKGPLEQRL